MGEPLHVRHFRDKHLRDCEHVLAFSRGYVGKIMGRGEAKQCYGVLVVTDQRVVFYRRGFFGERISSIDIDEVSSIEHRVTLGHRTISVLSASNMLTFKTFERTPFGEVIDALESEKKRRREVARPTADLAAELRELAELRKDGLLDENEYERAKELYLDKAPDQQDKAINLLRGLHDLYKHGVLSESEFNFKKWDILSK